MLSFSAFDEVFDALHWTQVFKLFLFCSFCMCAENNEGNTSCFNFTLDYLINCDCLTPNLISNDLSR